MKRIYIDVTQLCNWQGKVTGIQRVMYEISSRFRGDDEFEPVFIAWQRSAATFYEVNFDEIETNLTKVQSKSQKAKGETRRAKYISLFKRVYHYVPLSRTMYNGYSLARGFVTKMTMSRNIVTIEPGSTLFMPHGGVWESHTYIAEILKLKKKRQVKLVPILFDMCPVICPQFVVEPVREAFENYMKQVLPQSDLVLSISKNTASDAKLWLKARGQNDDIKMKVFRLGDEVGGEAQEPVKVSGEFALCVGTIEARKNHAGLYYAYKLAAQQGREMPQMVIAGRRGWMSGDTYELMKNDPDVKGKFIFIHSASDSQLAWLYAHAMFTVYPSFYEGWGLPIAESLLRGTPCLASETSSMKEIAGDLVAYYSPFSSDEIMKTIFKYSSDPDALSSFKRRVSEEYKTTTWDMSYREVSAEIKKL